MFGLCSTSVYVIISGQADIEKVESHLEFRDMVLDFFRRNGKTNILRWVCSKEEHKDQGYHYCMAIKLDRQRRWLSLRKDLDQRFGVKVQTSTQLTTKLGNM